MIQKFIRKPRSIQAVQWNGANVDELVAMGVDPLTIRKVRLAVREGDWIINESGACYPCPKGVFEELYEKLEGNNTAILTMCDPSEVNELVTYIDNLKSRKILKFNK